MEDIKTISLILGKNYNDAEIDIKSHVVYKNLKKAIERYETNLKLEAEEMMEKFDTDSFESDKVKIQKIKRATKKPVDGLKEGMVGVKQELVQDTKALNDYVKENGKLPDGWYEVMSEFIKFTIK
mgnify:CR=1 FL=1